LKAPTQKDGPVEVVSLKPSRGRRAGCCRNFTQHAYRQRPVTEAEAGSRFLPVGSRGASRTGSSFADAMIAGYTAVLCFFDFLRPSRTKNRAPLDDYALRFAGWRSSLEFPARRRTSALSLLMARCIAGDVLPDEPTA